MEKTIQTYQVEKTPFTIIEIVEEEKFKIAIGNNIISKEDFETKEKAEEYINEKPWDILLNTMALFFEMANKTKEQTTKN